MIVLFHVPFFSYRGTETATYDYALYNTTILHNTSIIVSPHTPQAHTQSTPEVVQKFQAHFPIRYYTSQEELELICQSSHADVIHYMKYGTKDSLHVNSIPMVVQCVFCCSEPHGLVYAGVSPSVSRNKFPFVPHIVSFASNPQDEYPSINQPRGKHFRKQLHIPEDALVFGRHGGPDTFNIPYARDVILNIIRAHKNIYFLFAVRPMIFTGVDPADYNYQIQFMEPFSDPRIKQRFIQTCDAMIHACTLGESFGLSVLEFSYFNKPVITWNGGLWHKQHLDHLREKVILYSDPQSLKTVLTHFQENKKEREKENPNFWTIRTFTPEYVMPIFDSVFLSPVRNRLKK